MAGPNNPAAKEQFDGMYDYYDSHRAKGWKPPQADNEYLMGWKIDDSESGTGSYDSATDGDMDIAYALLLADKQWGSNGKINYHQAAVDMINKGIRVFDYHGDSRRLMLGNWDSHPNTTRTSDWMPGHLRAYYDATGDAEWLSAIATIYTMVDELNTYNGGTGIMPDFVTGDTAVPDFDAENGIGDEYSDTFGDYYYNAARTPLRLAMDFIHNGNTNSKAVADQLIAWAKTEIGVVPNFNAFCSGYTVKGEAQIGDGKSYGCPVGDKGSTAFVAPVVVAASVSEAHQAFVNDGWNYIKENQSGYYYQDTINLLSMLALTGNWWAPNEL